MLPIYIPPKLCESKSPLGYIHLECMYFGGDGGSSGGGATFPYPYLPVCML